MPTFRPSLAAAVADYFPGIPKTLISSNTPPYPSPPALLTDRLLRQIERGAHSGLTRDVNVLTNAVRIRVACGTKRDQVGFRIIAGPATPFFVVRL